MNQLDRRIECPWFLVLIVMATAVVTGCATTGPVEVLDDREGEEGDCRRAPICLERGEEAASLGRFDEAEPYFAAACRQGSEAGCRRLADGLAVGAYGAPDIDTAARLYLWGCQTRAEAESCHSLGELLRSDALGDAEEGARYFRRACQMGDERGCHDEAVVWIESGEPDDRKEERAVERFRTACDQGLAVGCTNLAYMKAAGRGVGRAHDEAKILFEQACAQADESWSAHPLMGLSDDDEPQVYGAALYTPTVACDQLEVLVVGGYEARILSAFDAEMNDLRSCYGQAAAKGERRAGRLTIEAGVTADGGGLTPRIVDDELGIPAVAQCVDAVLARHLRDANDADPRYGVRWTVSFVFPPEDAGESSDTEISCDGRAVQNAVAPVAPAAQECGRRHIDEWGGEAGAVVTRWRFDSHGRPTDITMTSTVGRGRLTACLQDAIGQLELPTDGGDNCIVQVPFSFSDGHHLHITVIGR